MPHPTPAPIPDLPEGLVAEPIPGGYFVKRVEGFDVRVVLFGQSARVSTHPVHLPEGTYGSVYCYYGPNRVLNAVLAANAWPAAPGSTPAGYNRAWRGI